MRLKNWLIYVSMTGEGNACFLEINRSSQMIYSLRGAKSDRRTTCVSESNLVLQKEEQRLQVYLFTRCKFQFLQSIRTANLSKCESETLLQSLVHLSLRRKLEVFLSFLPASHNQRE